MDPLALEGSCEEALGILGRNRIWIAALSKLEFDQAGKLFAFLEIEASGRKPGFKAMLALKLMELFLLLYRTGNRELGGAAASAPKFGIEEVLVYIQGHYTEPLSLSGLASRYGLAPAYFSRLFKAKAGLPLFEHINRLRIQRSCLLLKRTNAEIIEIAFSVGYNNLSHFNRYFRKIMDQSPREYRKASRK